MSFEKLPAQEGKLGGCLNCGVRPDTFPMEGIIAVGFGYAGVTKNGSEVYTEPQVSYDDDGEPIDGPSDDDYWTGARAEEAAAADPDHDWRIVLEGPLSGRTYQRQGESLWVLVDQNQGFA